MDQRKVCYEIDTKQWRNYRVASQQNATGPQPEGPGPTGPWEEEDPNIYYYNI